MSWEEDYKHECPCFCGKGTIVSWSESNDWGNHKSGEYLNCEDCKEKYVYAFVDPYSAYRQKTDGYAWITKEKFAEYQKKQQEEEAKQKELRIQELKQMLDEWKRSHTLKWFKLMEEYMRLQGKQSTEEFKALREEYRQYEAKLALRREGSTKPRRPMEWEALA